MTKITKIDFKNDAYYLKLIVFYTIVLIVVYSYLGYVENLPIWACALIGLGILMIGGLIFYLRVRHVAIKRINESEKEAVDEKNNTQNQDNNE